MCQITLLYENRGKVVVQARPGETLLDLIRTHSLPVDAPCGGKGTCGKCRIKLSQGQADTGTGGFFSEEEKAGGWCLACQSQVRSDASFFVPESSFSYAARIQVTDCASSLTHSSEFGLAIDIGTTTVAAVLMDGSTAEKRRFAVTGNAQIRFGADVISRILEQQKEGGVRRLQDAIVGETLNPLIEALSLAEGIAPCQIVRIAIAANTTMNHLLLGVSADSIRREPFVPAFYEKDPFRAEEIGLCVSQEAEVVLAPNVGAFVGGDITAAVFSSRIWEREELSLLIDLGTNGELVLGNREFLLCCACSAGPAFEGGEISCGMRAVEGAIEACRIDPVSMEPAFKVIGPEDQRPSGICGSGLIDLVSALFAGGIISPKGKFIREGKRIRRDEFGMGSYVLVFREESGSDRDIEINEADLDNFIRAKGAIFSAMSVMLRALDLTADAIGHVDIAGGIGGGINIDNAISIGMLPSLPVETYRYIGNAALSGACEILFSSENEEKLREIARGMTYLELGSDPSYMEAFVAECFLPHTDGTTVS